MPAGRVEGREGQNPTGAAGIAESASALSRDVRPGRDGGPLNCRRRKGRATQGPSKGEYRKGVAKRRSGNVRRMAPAGERVAAGMCRRGKEPQERRSGGLSRVRRARNRTGAAAGALQRTPPTRRPPRETTDLPRGRLAKSPRSERARPSQQAADLPVDESVSRRRGAEVLGGSESKWTLAGRGSRNPLERRSVDLN